MIAKLYAPDTYEAIALEIGNVVDFPQLLAVQRLQGEPGYPPQVVTAYYAKKDPGDSKCSEYVLVRPYWVILPTNVTGTS